MLRFSTTKSWSSAPIFLYITQTPSLSKKISPHLPVLPLHLLVPPNACPLFLSLELLTDNCVYVYDNFRSDKSYKRKCLSRSVPLSSSLCLSLKMALPSYASICLSYHPPRPPPPLSLSPSPLCFLLGLTWGELLYSIILTMVKYCTKGLVNWYHHPPERTILSIFWP